MNSLAQLLVDRARPEFGIRVGTVDPRPLAEVVEEARATADVLIGYGLAPGGRVALIGSSSAEYFVAWAALQLLGAEAALINPAYPAELLARMCADIVPDAVLWCGGERSPSVAPGAIHLDTGDLIGNPYSDMHWRAIPLRDMPGLRRGLDDIAGYMHTSGTTGSPKICAQSHRYFLQLGRTVADGWALSGRDTVYVPLPLFHINPLGYGVIGGLVGGSSIVLGERFSASGFWPDVVRSRATVLVLHSPPVEILLRTTTSEDADGHSVRAAFLADREFQERFDIPLLWSAYGSTEGGGLSHLWGWRRGEYESGVLQPTRVGGRSRGDIDWSIADDGEILLRAEPGVLVSGYLNQGKPVPLTVDAEGWFRTGDLGRVDEHGRLRFLERRTESIRVKGEYVPIGYVEERFSAISEITDLALWRQDSELVDHELVLYLVAAAVPIDEIATVSAKLPPFLRPAVICRVAEIPRDDAVGKIRRRDLARLDVLEQRRI
jgi:carnitine-CoA ligase